MEIYISFKIVFILSYITNESGWGVGRAFQSHLLYFGLVCRQQCRPSEVWLSPHEDNNNKYPQKSTETIWLPLGCVCTCLNNAVHVRLPLSATLTEFLCFPSPTSVRMCVVAFSFSFPDISLFMHFIHLYVCVSTRVCAFLLRLVLISIGSASICSQTQLRWHSHYCTCVSVFCFLFAQIVPSLLLTSWFSLLLFDGIAIVVNIQIV